MAANSPVSGRTCPNCAAALPAGARACGVCKLEVSRMAAFAAAKRAALERGIQTTEVEPSEMRGRRNAGMIIKVILLVAFLGGAGWLGWRWFGPKPPRWAGFPSTGEAAVQELFGHIATGEDKEYDLAYAQIPDTVRDPKDSEERGEYRQLFHVIYLYLTGEFNPGWVGHMQIAADPADATRFLVKVDVETLHVRVAQMTPAEQMPKLGPHYGVTEIEEFPISEAQGFQRWAGTEGALQALAGKGAVDMLEGVRSALDPGLHETRMQKKLRLLSALRNPHQESWRAILQTYPIRDDPVVRARLKALAGDPRYDLRDQTIAQQVLDDKVPQEYLDGTGIPNNQ